MQRLGIDVGSDALKVIEQDGGIITSWPITEVNGAPWQHVLAALEELAARNVEDCVIGITGSGIETIAKAIGLDMVHEQIAIVTAVSELYPETRTVIEMGRKGQKCLRLAADSNTGQLTLAHEKPPSKCASGSGAFIMEMVKQLKYSSISEFIKAALTAEPVDLAGRCVVFLLTEVIHKRNMGIPRDRLAAGIIKALGTNFRTNFARGRKLVKPIFIGGVSENEAIVQELKESLGLDELIVPVHNRTLGAIGAAMYAQKTVNLAETIDRLRACLGSLDKYDAYPPLRSQNVITMPPRMFDEVPYGTEFDTVGIGVDIGSTSTKSALVGEYNGELKVLESDYGETGGDPLLAVVATIQRLKSRAEAKGLKLGKIVAATTGSGRSLTGHLVGTRLVINEITAQAASAPMYDDGVDTIFEIGGQDSKYIRLDGEVIIDFEMNRACAGGCGAFLQKTVKSLGMTYDDLPQALEQNQNPPIMANSCAVFIDDAMVHHQQAGVPTPDLLAAVCLASGANYLEKNVAGRNIGERIAFQGAPAKSPPMAAALAQVTGKTIVIPPYPEITGAIGAARLALMDTTGKADFRGFDEIANVKYEVSSFTCKSCSNLCEVNTFQIKGGPKHFYNDRCEKYSGAGKPNLGKHLPHLFDERAAFMKKWADCYGVTPKEGAKKIVIPQGGMFSEYYPLWKPYFNLLGFEVAATEDTNSRIIDLGVDRAVGEPCFPFKVANGHYARAVEMKPDYIFFPHLFSAEKSREMRKATTCPYWPAAPSVFREASPLQGQTKLLSPELHFDRGMGHIARRMVEMAVKELGCNRKKARESFVKACKAFESFRKEIQDHGREVLEALPPEAMAFVLVARPYTYGDDRMRLNIEKRIQDLGILAIPQDMLPLEEADISDSWPNAYAKQIQKKLKAARLIRHDVRLRAVVVTYFACGQDSFGNPFFQAEIGEPCYVMYLDEHSAEAGIVTRIEAFADTAINIKKAKDFQIVRSQDDSIKNLRDTKVKVPSTYRGADMLAASFNAFGIEAEPIEASPDPRLTLARQAIPEDVCLPMLRTSEDMLYRLQKPDFDRSCEGFFMVNSQGPCRVGMYSMYMRLILDKLGYSDVPIITIGSMNSDAALGLPFGLVAWAALVTHDLLYKMLLRVRPYAFLPKQAEDCFNRFVAEAVEAVAEVKRQVMAHPFKSLVDTRCLGALLDVLTAAAAEFASIPCRQEYRPLISVVGEWFVRLNEFSNQDILRKLEAAGAETTLAPATEFMGYSNYIDKLLSADRWRDGQRTRAEAQEFAQRWVNHNVMTRYEHALFHATLPLLEGREDIGPAKIIENGSECVSWCLGGEAILTMGTSMDAAGRGYAGIVNVMPFGCGPSTIAEALSEPYQTRYGGIPWLGLAFDGFTDPSLSNKLAILVWRAKIYDESRLS